MALERAEDRIAKLEEENGSLRELVEDMRAALQSSDARCLALQVSGGGCRGPGLPLRLPCQLGAKFRLLFSFALQAEML